MSGNGTTTAAAKISQHIINTILLSSDSVHAVRQRHSVRQSYFYHAPTSFENISLLNWPRSDWPVRQAQYAKGRYSSVVIADCASGCCDALSEENRKSVQPLLFIYHLYYTMTNGLYSFTCHFLCFWNVAANWVLTFNQSNSFATLDWVSKTVI